MAETKTFYRPGLLFKSKTKAHQEVCRSKYVQRAVTGEVISEVPELLAEFAVHLPEYTFTTFDGTTDVAADIRGHYFDLDSQAEQKGWSDEDKEIVARHMIRMAEKFPGGDFVLYSKPATPKPWPKYDSAEWGQIAVLAEQLGLVGEALAYEKENKNRKGVISKLEELLNAAAGAEVIESELVAQ